VSCMDRSPNQTTGESWVGERNAWFAAKTRTAPRDGRGTGRDVNPPGGRIAPSIRAAGPPSKTQIYKTAAAGGSGEVTEADGLSCLSRAGA